MKTIKPALLIASLILTTPAHSESERELTETDRSNEIPEAHVEDGRVTVDISVLQEMISYYENNGGSSFTPSAKHRYCVPVPDESSKLMICNDCVSQPFGGTVGLAYCAIKHGHTAHYGRCNEPRNRHLCER